MMILLLAVPAVLTWQPLELRHLPLLGLSSCGTTGQFLMVGAFQIAEASALAPVDFLRLIFAVAAGYAVFGEVPDLWTWAGAGIIIGAVGYATHRERLAMARAAADHGKTP
jgi:drug/metabolite transporter (DMT)-like permease